MSSCSCVVHGGAGWLPRVIPQFSYFVTPASRTGMGVIDMKKVCLVKGGDFVLGIEARYIIARQQEIPPPETVTKESGVFHLSSLLAQKRCEGLEPGAVVLYLQKGEHTFFLLVDQVIDEIELPEQTTQLPPPSPALTEQLCPHVAIYMNLVVLLLDPAQVISVARQLGQGIGILASEHCRQISEQEVDERPLDPVDVVDKQPAKGRGDKPEATVETGAEKKSAVS
ncbi:MAG: hypothetical protein D3910_26555, partial [Candidatus Electrothrix sp. ATG2]|nr:hypothetical protein [Candidatus Electrothrix sp. ATG2]